MADRVLDASALAKAILPEPGSDLVHEMLAEATGADSCDRDRY
jgi:predicted nucleic acid-binding protein